MGCNSAPRAGRCGIHRTGDVASIAETRPLHRRAVPGPFRGPVPSMTGPVSPPRPGR